MAATQAATAGRKPDEEKTWMERVYRSGYFFGALLLHLIIGLLIATWVIFPAFHPPTEDFTKTYLPPSSPPPPPPPPTQSVSVPTQVVSPPTQAISSVNPTATFSVPMPDIAPTTTPTDVQQKMTQKVESKATNALSTARLSAIMTTEGKWGRDRKNILESNSDPRNVTAKFPVYLASYAAGDWGCNTIFEEGKITAGSLCNLVGKINEWSHGNIKGEVEPQALNIGGPDLLAKAPPFIFFTGHKDFILTEQEVTNLREYIQVGGCIWGDNALAGRGSRFDVAFRREMKRVVPDLDKNFEPVDEKADVFSKSWFPIAAVPKGMNYYAEPLEHLDVDGKLAIFYTPNDYSDMFSMYILPGDTKIGAMWVKLNDVNRLRTNEKFEKNHTIFFRNFDLPNCLASQQLGMNIIGYLLVRFDKDLVLAPP